MSKIGLVVIFNHRYDKNIPILKGIYEKQFENIKFLVPFYTGNNKDVIPVYECSYQFPGYLVQAYEKLKAMDCDYYLFIGDDLILNKNLNSNNLINELGMINKQVFISGIKKLNSKRTFFWSHSRVSSRAFLHTNRTNWEGNILCYKDALKKFNLFFEDDYKEIYDDDFFGEIDSDEDKEQKRLFIKQNGGTYKIPYPLAFGYSDIFIISKDKLFDISHTCGVFSAMNLFAEIGLPTAIVMNVKRSKVQLLSQTKFTAKILWNEERRAFGEKYNYSMDGLLQDWKREDLYVHPIKLSEWKFLD